MKNVFILLLVFLFSAAMKGQEILKVKITDLEKTIAESKSPLIVNFWATWCKPCIEELPHFLEESKKHVKDSLQLILVSLDMEEAYPQQIKKSMIRNKINVPVQWLDETNADYFCPRIDTKWSGAIPASLFINNKTGYRRFIEEQLSHDELKKEIKHML